MLDLVRRIVSLSNVWEEASVSKTRFTEDQLASVTRNAMKPSTSQVSLKLQPSQKADFLNFPLLPLFEGGIVASYNIGICLTVVLLEVNYLPYGGEGW